MLLSLVDLVYDNVSIDRRLWDALVPRIVPIHPIFSVFHAHQSPRAKKLYSYESTRYSASKEKGF